MQEMAEAMGVHVVAEVPRIDDPHWVDECQVLLLPIDYREDDAAEAIAWCVGLQLEPSSRQCG